MEHLLEAYASGSSDDSGSEDKKSPAPVLGELPPELRNIFKDSEYDLATERLRAEERAGRDTPWVRRFPHERGNWPTHVFIPVPNSKPFKRMAEASVAHFRQRLATAWRERHGSGGRKRGKKRARHERSDQEDPKTFLARRHEPPEVVMNSMEPSGQQHLSLSRTTVLLAHQIEPFVQGLKEAVKSSRSFLASVVSGYDVLVNEDKTRSFVCLRVRGGREMILKLIAKVDPLMRKFKQAEYYEDPVIHVSVASVLGDVSAYVDSSCDQELSALVPGSTTNSPGRKERNHRKLQDAGSNSDDVSEDDDDEHAPSQVARALRPQVHLSFARNLLPCRKRTVAARMSSTDSQRFYPDEIDHYQASGASHSINVLLERISRAKSRIILLKEIKEDGEARLAAQEVDFAIRDREIEQMKEKMDRELQKNDKTLSDAALGVRSRDRTIITLKGQLLRGQMAMQNHHKNKHRVVAQAKKEVREEMRLEREQKQATLDIQRRSAGHSYSNSSNAKEMGRRTPSSGSFFSRASAGGGGIGPGNKMARTGK